MGQRPKQERRCRSFYPTTTQNKIAIVEHRGLAGRDGALRLIEADFDARWIGRGRDRRLGSDVLVANLDLRANRAH